MAKAYTPGLKVSARTTHRTRRLLPIPGEVKVAVGDVVAANDVVAETFMDGDITPMNMANRLSCSAGDVAGLMLKQIGEPVKEGEPIARSKGIFGAFKTEVAADADGTLEQVSSVTGQVMIRGAAIPVQVRAYLSGTVVEVLPKEGCIIENDVMFVQGIFGIGGETEGVIQVACGGHEETLDADAITADMKDAVILVSSFPLGSPSASPRARPYSLFAPSAFFFSGLKSSCELSQMTVPSHAHCCLRLSPIPAERASTAAAPRASSALVVSGATATARPMISHTFKRASTTRLATTPSPLASASKTPSSPPFSHTSPTLSTPRVTSPKARTVTAYAHPGSNPETRPSTTHVSSSTCTKRTTPAIEPWP